MSRPEHKAPPEIFYNEDEARKYSNNTRIMTIQTQMCERAIELLLLPANESCLILDIGCGSGLSGGVLEEQNHIWIGVDIAQAMLDVAVEREVEGDLVLCDMGQGMPFKAAAFDGAVSISALQWLCNADRTTHNPVKRLYSFFSTLYACLTRSARAVFQFYPENPTQVEFILSQAMRAGFHGGLVIDYPNSTKAKKYFLVLMSGGVVKELPKGLSDEVTANDDQKNLVGYNKKRDITNRLNRGGKVTKKSKQWILQKKERRRRQGKETRKDTKYTGRKRQEKF